MIVRLNNSKNHTIAGVDDITEKKGPESLSIIKPMIGEVYDYITIHLTGAMINIKDIVAMCDSITVTRLVIYDDDGETKLDEIEVYPEYAVNGIRAINNKGSYVQIYFTDYSSRKLIELK